MWLFLDFDGVLHPEIFRGKDFSNLPLFEEAVFPFLGEGKFKIVLSTAWRSSFPLERLKQHFSPEIATHIVSATPELPNGFCSGGREKEINLWLSTNASTEDEWIALDDRSELFHKENPRLVWIDSSFGMQKSDVDVLQQLMNYFLLKKSKSNG